MNYTDFFKLSPTEFNKYLVSKIVFDDIEDTESAEGCLKMSKRLVEISNSYSELSILLMHARVYKRNEARIGTKVNKEDMVDIEANIKTALEALDLQYKAINRTLLTRADNLTEQRMLGAL